MTERHWESLEEPLIIELDSHLSFLLATKVSYVDVKINVIHFEGKQYGYEDGEVVMENERVELQCSFSHDGYCAIDENGNFID